jgi:hypothetical protein
MRGLKLAIEQCEPACPQARHQMRKGDFGGISCPAEHAFSKKGPAKRNAIKAANKLSLQPCFNRMGMTKGVEAQHGLFNLAIDPRARPIRGGGGAAKKNLVKGAIITCLEPLGADRFAQRARQVKPLKR